MNVGDVAIGPDRLTVIAGPCLAESLELCQQVAHTIQDHCRKLDLGFIFKASFDKANRTSNATSRGQGLEAGLEVISRIGREFGVPTTTDIHESTQAAVVGECVDLLQVPAFLSRQTDLLEACAATGRPVNVKKGQFMSPWDAKNIVEKLQAFEASGIMLTERGTTFGYNALVVDMPGLEIMRSFGVPVCFDGTHSAQRPGAGGGSSGGHRDSIPALVRAAMAVGVDALFLEVHPRPESAMSDAATQWPLDRSFELLQSAQAVWNAAKSGSLPPLTSSR